MMKLKIGLALFFLFHFVREINAQDVNCLLAKLDSTRHSSSVSKYFADIYFKTTVNAVKFFSGADERVRGLISRMMNRFGDYFFLSANAYRDNSPMPAEWKAYYANKDAHSLEFVLLGINAHINGDIWQALTTAFTSDELREIKPWYYAYYSQLLEEYNTVYEMAIGSSTRLRLLHDLSFGMDNLYGKTMLMRWRRRQMQLAEDFFTDKTLFEHKLKKLRKKMIRLDNLIRKYA